MQGGHFIGSGVGRYFTYGCHTTNIIKDKYVKKVVLELPKATQLCSTPGKFLNLLV